MIMRNHVGHPPVQHAPMEDKMRFKAILAGALLFAGGSVHAAPAAQNLGQALEGRVAGEAVRCVGLRQLGSSRVVPGNAILFGSGSTVFANVPQSGADTLRDHDILVMRTVTNSLCAGDVVQLVEPSSHIPRGFVILGDFVPHRRATH
jgi:hypothetical protein